MDDFEQFPEKNPVHYRWKLFYYNPNDPRTTLEKPKPGLGVMLNFARRGAWGYLLGAVLFFGFVIAMISIKNAK